MPRECSIFWRVRLTDEEHAEIRRLAGPQSVQALITAWIWSPPPPLEAPAAPARPGLARCAGRPPRAGAAARVVLPLRLSPASRERLAFLAESMQLDTSELLRAWLRGASAGRREAEQLRAAGEDLEPLIARGDLGRYVASLIPAMPPPPPRAEPRARRAKAPKPLDFEQILDAPNWTSSDPRQADFFGEYLQAKSRG